jgi:5-(carboxyamino)imidazole ribonucleotide mutase|tara:strand:+ start:812 stop:1309 length:498 start_codon:yes stop_codon:yes gene_type:complete
VKFNNQKKLIIKVAIVMGSQSDYPIMKECEKILKILKIRFETKIISAHRTPERMFDFAKFAEKNKFTTIIAGAGGSAHLPGMIASMTTIPVIGVPIESKKLKGLDSILSICQMPLGVVVATVAINGSFNAGLLAASIIGTFDSKVRFNLQRWRSAQTKSVKKKPK